MSRVVYRILVEDGLHNLATGQSWTMGELLEGAAISPEWAKGLLAEGAIKAIRAPVKVKKTTKAKESGE